MERDKAFVVAARSIDFDCEMFDMRKGPNPTILFFCIRGCDVLGISNE